MNQFNSNSNNERFVLNEEDDLVDFGSRPYDRTIPELLNNGIIFVDKQSGPTSHQIVSWVRSMLNQSKAGHSGTLDPQVTGLLPIGLGDATKALSILLYGSKEYVAILRLHNDVNPDSFTTYLSEFTGKIFQKPPQRSAVKRRTRTREIYDIKPLDSKGRLICLKILCEAGTYIRKLIYDIGEVLGCGATMIELRRTKVMHIDENTKFVTLHDLNDAMFLWKSHNQDEKIRSLVKPVEFISKPLNSIMVRSSAIDSICHGAQLAIPGILNFSKSIQKGDNISLISQKEELIAIAKSEFSAIELQENKKGIASITQRVIMRPSTYPKMWKKNQIRE